jgi:hypothetical protein
MKDSRCFGIGMVTLCIFAGLIAAGCGTLTNLLNPIHAVDENGNKVPAALDSLTQKYKIEGFTYSYKDRPAVPAAPQKPVEPRKPSPPAWSISLIEVETEINGNKRYTKESFSSREEAIKKINFYSSQGRRNDISPLDASHALRVAAAISGNFEFYEGEQKQYESALAQYQAAFPKYQQGVKEYEKENAEYQANLPNYRAKVETEIKSIQDSINPNAPGNWIGYVEGKYLLYRGKVE